MQQILAKIQTEYEEDAARKIWARFGGQPEGVTGCIVSNFIKWYQRQTARINVDLSELSLNCFPSRITGIFTCVQTLDLSNNPGLSVVPDIQCRKLNISNTGITQVPFYLATEVIMTGMWVELPEEDLYDKTAKLKRLRIDGQILQGVFPSLYGSCLEHVKIGEHEGTPAEVEEKITDLRIPEEQSLHRH